MSTTDSNPIKKIDIEDLPIDQLDVLMELGMEWVYRAPQGLGEDLQPPHSRQWTYWRLEMLRSKKFVERRRCFFMGRYLWEYRVIKVWQVQLQEEKPRIEFNILSTPADA